MTMKLLRPLWALGRTVLAGENPNGRCLRFVFAGEPGGTLNVEDHKNLCAEQTRRVFGWLKLPVSLSEPDFDDKVTRGGNQSPSGEVVLTPVLYIFITVCIEKRHWERWWQFRQIRRYLRGQ